MAASPRSSTRGPIEPLTDDLASVPLDADRDGALLKMAVAQHGLNTPMGALWYGMPFRDSISTLTGNRFWEEASPLPLSRHTAPGRHRHVLLGQFRG